MINDIWVTRYMKGLDRARTETLLKRMKRELPVCAAVVKVEEGQFKRTPKLKKETERQSENQGRI